MRRLFTLVGVLALLLPASVFAARTDALWDYLAGANSIQPNASATGVNLLIYGLNHYINFGTITGSSGYGIRDNSGTIECKNSGGSWAACAGGGSGGTGTVTEVDTGNGLTGGPITTTGTLLLDQSYGAIWTAASSTYTQHLSLNTASSSIFTTPLAYITRLANLASPGFVKTSSDGTLSVDTNTYLTGNQSIALSGDVSGSGTTAITTTLATVNSNVGSFTNASVTVDGKGRVTAASSGAASSGSGNVSTSTGETTGQLAYWTSTNGTPALLGKVATGTISAGSSAITVTAGRAAVGGALAIDCATASGSQIGCLSSTDWSTFNGKQAAGTYLTTLGNYASTTGTAISFSTSTLSFNGLTVGQTIAASANALLFTPTITGTLNNAGLANSSVVVNGTTFNLGDSKTITAASSTLLGDSNTWTKLQNYANASSTLFTCTTCWIGTLGGTMSAGGFGITNVLDPSSAQDAATKNYVDNKINGTDFKEAVKYATTAALPTVVYSNGASGVGATLTGAGVGALSLDSNTPSVGDRVLVKNQVSTFQNGIYSVTAVGSGAAVFVMTRTADFDQSADISDGDAVYVLSGTTNGGSTWVQTTTGTITVGTTALVFSQVAGPGSILAGSGISVSGLTVTCLTGSSSVFGCITSADWTTFNNKVATTRTLTAGNGLTGGGDLSADRSFAIDFTRANTWTGQQTFNTSAPIFGTLSGLLQGNGASAITAVAGTIGQFPYFNGTNTSLATSSIFVTGASNFGFGTVNPTEVNANARITVAGISSQDVIASTTDNTTLSDAIFRVYAPGSSMFIGSHGTNQITTQYGITVGGWAEIGAVNSTFGTSNGLLIGTRTTTGSIVFGTNSGERMRIGGTGFTSMGTTTSSFGTLTIATSTAPQIRLGDGIAADNQWAFRSISGNLFLATSTESATSTNADPFVGYIEFPSNGGCIGCFDLNLPGGINLRNAQYITATTTIITANAFNDVYTAPTGRRVFIEAVDGMSTTWVTYLKDTGTYYRLTASTTATAFGGSVTVGIILEPGQTLSVFSSGGGNLWIDMISYDSTVPFFSGEKLNPTSGTSTLYAVPSGRNAMLVGSAPFSNTTANAGNIIGGNNGTNAGSIIYFRVTSGQTAVNAVNQVAGSSLNANTKTNWAISSVQGFATLNSGDSIQYSSATSFTGGAIIWTNFYEH